MRFLAYLLLLVGAAIFGMVSLEFALKQVDKPELKREAAKKCDKIVADLNQRVDLTRQFADRLAKSQVSELSFLKNATALFDSASFVAAEWIPQVTPNERDEFEREIQLRLSRTELAIRYQSTPEEPVDPNATIYPVQFTTKSIESHRTVGLYRHHNKLMFRALQRPGEALVSRQLPHVLGNTQQVYCCLMAIGNVEASQQSQDDSPVGVVAVYFRDFVNASIADSGLTSIHALKLPPANNGAPKAVELDPVELKGQVLATRDFDLGIHRFRLEARERPAVAEKRAMLSWVGLILGPLVVCGILRARLQRIAKNLSAANVELTEEVSEHIESKRALQSMLTLREQERRLVASEIHDGFIQEATSAQMYLEALATRIDPDDEATVKHLENSKKMIQRAIAEGRQLINGLRPRSVDQLGLIPALQNLVANQEEQHGLSVALRYPLGMPELEIQTQRSLYRIVQESLSNIRKHSGVAEAIVSLHVDGEFVTLDITDQGRGFEMNDLPGDNSFGLRGIQERASVLGGEAIIKAIPDEGTSLSVRLPLVQPLFGVEPDSTRSDRS